MSESVDPSPVDLRLAGLRHRIEAIERSHDFGLRSRPVLTGSVPREPVLNGRKADVSHACLSFGWAPLDSVFTEGGLGFGVHQIAGDPAVAAAFAVLLLARRAAAFAAAGGRPRLGALVVQERMALSEGGGLHGPGLLALGIDPGGVGLVATRDGAQALRIADEALGARAVAAVVLELHRGRLDLSLTRRFNIAAQETDSFVFILTPGLEESSAALTRWQVAAHPSVGDDAGEAWVGPPAFDVELVRNRRGRCGRWTLEWSSDEQVFRPAVHPSLAAAPVRRPQPAAGWGVGPSPRPDDPRERRTAAAGG